MAREQSTPPASAFGLRARRDPADTTWTRRNPDVRPVARPLRRRLEAPRPIRGRPQPAGRRDTRDEKHHPLSLAAWRRAGHPRDALSVCPSRLSGGLRRACRAHPTDHRPLRANPARTLGSSDRGSRRPSGRQPASGPFDEKPSGSDPVQPRVPAPAAARRRDAPERGRAGEAQEAASAASASAASASAAASAASAMLRRTGQRCRRADRLPGRPGLRGCTRQ
jgi:hypothetical protein